uniref:PA domain-containing protein n=1 Tax=Anolis carolinensis TaxID=28377 RepID=A0A803SRI5_ANOCA
LLISLLFLRISNAIYVRVYVAVLVILILLCPTTDEALVRAVYNHNSISQDFEALPSGFGPGLSGEGLLGSLLEAEPIHACRPIRVAPPSNGSSAAFVALIRRHGCPFATKVLHAQRAGFQAAVVYNIKESLVTMVSEEEEAAREVDIPALFIGASASTQLKRIFHYDPTAYVILLPECQWDSCWDGRTDSRRSAWGLPKQASRCLPGHVHYLLLGFTAVIWIVALYVLCYL